MLYLGNTIAIIEYLNIMPSLERLKYDVKALNNIHSIFQ